MKNKLVKVTWYDTVTSDSWLTSEQVKETKIEMFESVGWLLFENDKQVTLVADTGNHHSRTIAIPRGAIVEIVYLRSKK